MADSKDTIYVDVDEEITGIISKIQNSPKDIVALVLPKRASVLQSIVNMKLLKRAQDQHKKKVVLITSESRILPLAGAAGLFVASNLTSKPYIPLDKVIKNAKPDAEDIDPNTPISQVAPAAKFADSDDKIEIDNTPKTPEPGAAAASDKKPKKNKKSKVPNFSKFRKKVILIALAVFILLFGLIYGLVFAPRANVTVKAQTDSLPTSFDFTADPNASGVDTNNKIVRASTKSIQKDSSEQVNASGTKNKGDKADGSVQMSARKCGGDISKPPSSVPSGAGVSANNVTFITQESTQFTTSGFHIDSQNPNCYVYPASDNTEITAQSAGSNGNVNNANFSVAGRSDVSAQGSASGGTDNNVKVVTQADVDKAKERISGEPNTSKDDFKSQLQRDGYVAIEDSFKADPGKYSITPKVGDEGDQVTVSVTTTYSMLGIKKEDLQELIKNQVASQDQGKSILSDGIDNATIKVGGGSGLSDGQVGLNINTTVVVGPNINQDDLKKQIAGKKTGEAEAILGQVAGLSDPKVDLSPFWVGRVPKSNSKITIEIQQSDGSSIP